MIQEKKKKQGTSSDNDISERVIVHTTGIVEVVSTKTWASVASSDDDDELLPILGMTSLGNREC